MDFREVTISAGLAWWNVQRVPHPLGLSGVCKRRLESHMGLGRAQFPCILRPLRPALSAIPP